MNSSDASRQIQQMIEFIMQEAREKAEEIEVKTESEFNAKKLTKIQQARQQIQAEFAQRKKEYGSQRRIARSRLINSKRFDTMRARDDMLKTLRDKIRDRLATVSEDPKYEQLVLALMVEGLATVLESEVEIVCREVDDKIVRAQLPAAVAHYKRLVKEETGSEPEITVTVSSKRLPPPPVKGSQALSSTGGVMVTARGGKIICRNTLDARFDLAYAQLLPTVREILFGRRAVAGKALA